MTEKDWDDILTLKCLSKRGHKLTQEQFEACMDAYKENPQRYKELDKLVFELTKPFGAH